eukprot:3935666-Rhodomonas_salina.1
MASGPPTHGPIVEARAATIFADTRGTAEDDGAAAAGASGVQVHGSRVPAGTAVAVKLRARLALARITPILATRKRRAAHAPRLAPKPRLGRDGRVPLGVAARRAFRTRQAPPQDAVDGVRCGPNRCSSHDPERESRAFEQ